ncbi:MAG: methyltransferase domain-containing protein [Gemmatimonadetes bacterium]|nr:methyltransferase domain-containing protein [Gemmatimonadota bacterium]
MSGVDAFARFEHDGWERVATRYDAVWTGLTTRFADLLLDAVGVASGMWLLDVACGPGHVTAAAARRGARSLGLDFSAAMLEIAHARYPDLEFHRGDAAHLPFADRAFDRVVMNFGVLHLPDPDRGFAEARRVLRPGGSYGFTVWTGPERNRGMGIVAEAVEAEGRPAAGIPEGPDRLRFADGRECRRALGAVGFAPHSVAFATHEIVWTVPSATFLFEAQRDAAVRTAAVLTAQPPEAQARIRAAVEREAERYATADGFAIPMAAHVVTAVVEA